MNDFIKVGKDLQIKEIRDVPDPGTAQEDYTDDIKNNKQYSKEVIEMFEDEDVYSGVFSQETQTKPFVVNKPFRLITPANSTTQNFA